MCEECDPWYASDAGLAYAVNGHCRAHEKERIAKRIVVEIERG